MSNVVSQSQGSSSSYKRKRANSFVGRKYGVSKARGKISNGMRVKMPHFFSRSTSTYVNSTTSAGYTISTLTGSGVGASGFYDMEFSFSLSAVNVYIHGILVNSFAVPNSSEFSALFDQYCLDSVEVRPYFTNNSSGVSNSALTLPIFNWVVDHDDTASVNLSDIQQYGDMKTFQLGAQPCKAIIIKPRCTQLVYYNAVTSGYSQAKAGTWIDTANLAVPQYGMKCYIDPTVYVATGGSTLGYLNFNWKLNFRTRDTK